MRPVTANPSDPFAALVELIRASHENDLVEIAQTFTVDDPGFAPVFQINTTTPSLSNIAGFLATLLTAMQRGGINRTT